jgi:hypothetical protein
MQSDLLLGDLGDQMYHFIHLTLRLFSRNTTVRMQTWYKTPLDYYATPRTNKHTPRSYDVTSCDVTSNPVAILLPVMRNDTFYTNTIERKKRGKITSLPVPSLPVTWIPVMYHSLAMLLPVMRNGTFRTTAMIRTKARECTSGHV